MDYGPMTTDQLAQPAFRFPPSAFDLRPGTFDPPKAAPLQHRGINSLEKSIAKTSLFGQEYDQEYHVGSLTRSYS